MTIVTLSTSRKNQPNPIDDPALYDHLSEDRKVKLLTWISEELDPTPTVEKTAKNSYDLKHYFEFSHGGVSGGEFKGALLAAGYSPVNPSEKNWYVRAKLRDPHAKRIS